MTGYKGITEPHEMNDGFQINRFQELLGIQQGDSDTYGDPYCAAACVFAGCKALAVNRGIPFTEKNAVSVFRTLLDDLTAEHFKASASCGIIRDAAKARGRWLRKDQWAQAVPGDLVIFDFNKNPKKAARRHIGVVLGATAKSLHTIEANTGPGEKGNQQDGQGIFERWRGYGNVIGFVQTEE